jgi:hypothetical protein
MTGLKTYGWMAFAAVVLFAVSPIPVSQAVMITVNTGSFADVTPGAPVDLGIGSLQSSDTVNYVFENTADVTGLAVNLIGDGTAGDSSSPNAGTISGTLESVYFHFDPGESSDFMGSLTFDQEIAAVISVRDGFLDASDVFAPSDVTFVGTGITSQARGQLNSGDVVTVAGNMLTIGLSAGLNGADDFRVLFRSVPEPGTVALLGISLLALGFLRRRKMPTKV